ncbi:acyltransferase family protein [Streptosporangium sp. CA-135522]|uniref:acyltransferase family protein n=1 Tax=Streptosporangium sp. CA-135522 TaxID=3240072 RepID=UPI003D937E96
MSDTRSPFHVPTPRDDGAPDAGSGGSVDGQGRTPAPWPMPEHAQPSRSSWPEPPDYGAASARGDHRDGRGAEEDPGEVTAWGYPAYQEPAPATGRAEDDAWAHWDTQTPPGQQEGTPYRDSQPPAGRRERTSHRDTRPPAEPQPWSSGDVPPPAAPQTWGSPADVPPTAPQTWGSSADVPPTAPQTWGSSADVPPGTSQGRGAHAPFPRGPLDMTPSRPPAGNLLDPLDPAWASEPGVAQAGNAAWAPAAPQSAPRQQAPATAERPFSYWENSSRQPAPSPQEHFPQPERGARPEQEPRPEEEPAAPPVRKKRDPYLDNVKFVLIALVVTGHSLVPTLAAHSAKAAYLFIYTFHMPAFVLISGYLGRNFWNSNAKINKLVDTMLVPYAVVEIGYALLRFGLGQKWTLTIIDPAWLNWYLLALVLWRISTPIWTRMRQPLLVAVVIYMVAGFSEISGDFSIDRFFGLLPFYVLGLILKPEHFDLLKPLWVRIAGGIIILAGAGAAVFIAPRVGLDPVYFRYSFKSMDMTWLLGFGVRGAMLVAALVMSVALLAVVPRRETWFSDLGTRTLYAYLLHGVIVLIAKDQGWLNFPWLYGPLGVLAIASSGLVLAIVLCLPVTRTLFKWLLEPRLVWLYRRPSTDPSGTPAAATGGPAASAGRESSAAVTR